MPFITTRHADPSVPEIATLRRIMGKLLHDMKTLKPGFDTHRAAQSVKQIIVDYYKETLDDFPCDYGVVMLFDRNMHFMVSSMSTKYMRERMLVENHKHGNCAAYVCIWNAKIGSDVILLRQSIGYVFALYIESQHEIIEKKAVDGAGFSSSNGTRSSHQPRQRHPSARCQNCD